MTQDDTTPATKPNRKMAYAKLAFSLVCTLAAAPAVVIAGTLADIVNPPSEEEANAIRKKIGDAARASRRAAGDDSVATPMNSERNRSSVEPQGRAANNSGRSPNTPEQEHGFLTDAIKALVAVLGIKDSIARSSSASAPPTATAARTSDPTSRNR